MSMIRYLSGFLIFILVLFLGLLSWCSMARAADGFVLGGFTGKIVEVDTATNTMVVGFPDNPAMGWAEVTVIVFYSDDPAETEIILDGALADDSGFKPLTMIWFDGTLAEDENGNLTITDVSYIVDATSR